MKSFICTYCLLDHLIVQVGHPDHDQPQVPGDDPVCLQGQVSHRLEADQGRQR